MALLRVVTAGLRPQDGEEKLSELSRLCARLPLALRIAAERAASHPHMRLEELIADLRDESALWDALSSGVEGTRRTKRRSRPCGRYSPGPTGRCPPRLRASSACSGCIRAPPSGRVPSPRWRASACAVPGRDSTCWWAPTSWSRPRRTGTSSTTSCASTRRTGRARKRPTAHAARPCDGCWTGISVRRTRRSSGSNRANDACRCRTAVMAWNRLVRHV
ncbi:hypothetical protein NKH77_17475 [Streptomyces sp. M19]